MHNILLSNSIYLIKNCNYICYNYFTFYLDFTYEADKFNNSTTEKMDMEWGKQEKSC